MLLTVAGSPIITLTASLVAEGIYTLHVVVVYEWSPLVVNQFLLGPLSDYAHVCRMVCGQVPNPENEL